MQAVITAVAGQMARAEALAKHYGLALTSKLDASEPCQLVVMPHHIECRMQGLAKPLRIDFVQGKAKYRIQPAWDHPLVRSVGIKAPATVLDLTAGLGDDAFLLASLHYKVIMLERHPVVAILLADALQRLQDQANLSLSLCYIEAKNYLEHITVNPEIIIYDPMFPQQKRHQAKVKKGMQVLQNLVNHDKDTEEVFHLALARAQKRVIVKRPKTAPPIAHKTPSFAIKTRNFRFDGYVVN